MDAPALQAQADIYQDGLGSGWVDWSWGITRDLNSSANVQSGSRSISVTFNEGWAGLYFHRDSGLSTSGYTHLEFQIHGGNNGGQTLNVVANQNTSKVYAVKASARTWTKVSIPLSSLGSPSSISDLFFQDTAGKSQPAFYLDSIALVNAAPAPTATQVPPVNTAVPPTAQPTNPPAQPTAAPTQPPVQGSSYQIFGDNLANGWMDWSWSVNRNLNNSNPVQSGNRSAAVTFSGAWAGFYLHTDNAVSTSGYSHLTFWIHGGSAGSQRLKVIANQNDSKSYEVTASANQWKQISIPLSNLGSPSSINDLFWQDSTGKSQPVFYLDNIALISGTAAPTNVPPTKAPTQPPALPSITPTNTFLPVVTKAPTNTPTTPPTAVPTQPPAQGSSYQVFGDSLANGWMDWSWSVNRNLSNSSPVQSGSRSVAVTFSGAWSGFYLHTDNAVSTSGYSHLTFWIHGGSAGNQRVKVVANQNAANSYDVTATANQWKQISIPLSNLGSPSSIKDLYWQDNTGKSQPVLYLDNIALTGSGGTSPQPTSPPKQPTTPPQQPTSPPNPGSGLALNVDAAAGKRPISPYIYGMNFANEALAAELRLPVNRYGGNATTRYNWQNDTANRASDWYFENVPNNNSNPGALPNGSASDQFVDQNRRTGTASLLTIPMIGYTPKSRDYACGFAVSRYGAQQSTDPYRSDCGNGVYTNGSNITNNNPADTSIAIGPSFVQDWIRHLNGRYGSASNGGVRFYNLDNEPFLWNQTHRDVHPQPATYDEMRDRTIQYAAALKAVDPQAQTLGPVLWGWTAYFYSAKDSSQGGSWWSNPADRNAHGGMPFVEWYLQQMRAYEQSKGVRILDYLDLHYYPQQSNVALSTAVDSNTQALRLRSTRALWDSSYVDESWINEPVRLLPRMRDWVNTYYPGTKLAITEYNFGALNHINGALTQADVLGIFGREGLDLATLWDPPTASQPGAYAFRMYRNYDGKGGQFGDTSVRATSADQSKVAVYAATRGSDGAMTLMIINKTGSNQTATVSLANFNAASTAQVYRYSSANLNQIARQGDQTVNGSWFSATYPANSITLVVIPKR